MAYPTPTNTATLIGRLSRDPQLRTVTTSTGVRPLLNLGLAVRKPSRSSDQDGPTADFFNITVWGAQAEACAKHLTKGRLVAVTARLEPTATR
jgi:single-strand DNA-binding protein